MKTKKGFTLVELLVVIAIIAMLMSILMPSLARVRQLAFRMTCGTNLYGIGKAMFIYANDYENELPRAGGKESTLGTVTWNAPDRNTAYGLGPGGTGGKASVTSCLYLLVKFAEVTPKSFVCKSDSGASEFKLSDHVSPPNELIEAWDFGGFIGGDWPRKHCCYSYHQPLLWVAGTYPYALTILNEPSMAIAADWNPWMPIPDEPEGGNWSDTSKPPIFNPAGTSEEQKQGNAAPHQKDGQNVLFLDGHVYFEKRSYCGMEEDNIYTYWAGSTGNWEKRKGVRAKTAGFAPKDRLDSLLINDAPKMWCFPADMLVWVDELLLQISKVVAGQKVGKFDCAMLTASPEQIETVQEHEGIFECRDVVLENGNHISVVDTHCFLLDDGQWEMASKLRSGLKLQSLNGPVGIKSVVKRAMPLVGKVYNLKIRASDRYFVGSDAVIVRDY